jgi:uncharacterized membrane protein
LQLLFFIAAVITCFRDNGLRWMTVLLIVMISPLFVTPLYGILLVRDAFIRKYAMGHPLKLIPDGRDFMEFEEEHVH